jgi:predicted phosphoadenosine phosphosulfate sulfurtransferase
MQVESSQTVQQRLNVFVNEHLFNIFDLWQIRSIWSKLAFLGDKVLDITYVDAIHEDPARVCNKFRSLAINILRPIEILKTIKEQKLCLRDSKIDFVSASNNRLNFPSRVAIS